MSYMAHQPGQEGAEQQRDSARNNTQDRLESDFDKELQKIEFDVAELTNQTPGENISSANNQSDESIRAQSTTEDPELTNQNTKLKSNPPVTQSANSGNNDLEYIASQIPGFQFDNIGQLNDEELDLHLQKIIEQQNSNHRGNQDEQSKTVQETEDKSKKATELLPQQSSEKGQTSKRTDEDLFQKEIEQQIASDERDSETEVQSATSEVKDQTSDKFAADVEKELELFRSLDADVQKNDEERKQSAEKITMNDPTKTDSHIQDDQQPKEVQFEKPTEGQKPDTEIPNKSDQQPEKPIRDFENVEVETSTANEDKMDKDDPSTLTETTTDPSKPLETTQELSEKSEPTEADFAKISENSEIKPEPKAAPTPAATTITSDENKENEKKDYKLSPPLEFLETSTSTTSINGLTVPSTSELMKTEDSSALKAYKALLQEQESSFQPINVVNAQLAALPLSITAPTHLSFNIQLLVSTLPVLDNLSTQILRIISQGPYQKIMELVSNRESYTGIAFNNLIELFETTKRVYNSEESPFFTVENATFGVWKYGQPPPPFLKGKVDTVESTLRKVNLATFLLATLGLIDLGFFFLNEAFLDVFCPPHNLDPAKSITHLKPEDTLHSTVGSGSHPYLTKQTPRQPHSQTKFLKSQAILYLELKTQAFISAIELGDRSKNEIIQDLFPDNLDEILLRRKDPNYDPTKQKLVRNSTMFTPAELDFLARCDSRKEKLINAHQSEDGENSLMEKYEWIKFLNDLLDYVSKNVGFLVWGPKGKITAELTRLKLASPDPNQTIRNAQKRAFDQVDSASTNRPLTNATQSSSNSESQFNGTDIGNTDSSISMEVAQAEAENRANSRKSRAFKQNRPSTFRRTWSQSEEDALKEGLKLKGTHWTSILELYGPGGSVNETLKNRTSLQLKDKARNWKMYYLKNGIELPEYLLNVTGDKDKAGLGSGRGNKLKRPKTGNRNSNIQTIFSRPTTQTAPEDILMADVGSETASFGSVKTVGDDSSSVATPAAPVVATSANTDANAAAAATEATGERNKDVDTGPTYEDIINNLFGENKDDEEDGKKTEGDNTEKIAEGESSGKSNTSGSTGEKADDIAANELKDLVAEAFK